MPGRIPHRVVKGNLRADARALRRPHHRPPVVCGVFFQQQDFKLAARAGVHAAQPRRDDARIVQDEHVAGTKKFQEIAESAVFDAPASSIQNQEPRFVTPGCGTLCNQFRRQFKIEVGRSHPGKFQVSPFKLQVVRQRDLKSGLLA